ncbi:MAG TPA: YfiR family protein, partial [Verrucomicrobiae bacterium]|nr:YfiR family protein [Verrucomicrobiae bacterium]
MQRRTRLSFFWLLCQAVLLLILGAARGQAAPQASEAEVKAAFLYNFAKFVEWPTNAFTSDAAPLRVAVFGDEDFTTKLNMLLSDKKAHGRAFEVKKITNPQDAKNFHIVFITSLESKRSLLVLDAVKKSPVLTIGENDEFLDYGGMIMFYFE